MGSRREFRWWVHLTITVVAGMSTWCQPATSDPQTNPLGGVGCSTNTPTNTTKFHDNLHATFSDLRAQLSENRRFAKTRLEQPTVDPVFAMVQCRNYLSAPDCLTCYDTATSVLQTNCSGKTGARVTYNGCFLRYEGYEFYGKTNENALDCGPGIIPPSSNEIFSRTRQSFLKELEVVTPKIDDRFAASKKEISSEQNLTIYGVAQCVLAISSDACGGCLTTAYETISQGCVGSSDGRVTDAGCFMRFSDSPFFADDQITDLKPFLRGDKNKNKAIIGGVAGAAGFSIILVALVLWYLFSRKLKIATRGNILGATELQRPNRYSYRELEVATNYFSEEYNIGRGAFGFVYKAVLTNGMVLAVKKLNMSYNRAKEDFETEVRLISNVHHRNLIRLLGCCTKGYELLLIYEYMENGSLDKFLYGEKRGSLSWKQRCEIIFGTARGIAYLHEHYHVTIIHRDIKPSNILLDNEFQPKIADFGLARLLPEDQTHVSTKFAGTLGYTAPEYARNGHLSEKVDVYSFGIVILEIISGQRCSDMKDDTDAPYLLEEAWKLYEGGMHEKLADDKLGADEYEVKKMVEIGLVCTQSPASSRPSMSEVVAMISSSDGAGLVIPIRPSHSVGHGSEMNASVSSNRSSASNATVSNSHFTGR